MATGGGKGRGLVLVLLAAVAGMLALLPGLGEWLSDAGPLPPAADLGCVLNGESPARAMEAAGLYRRGVFRLVLLPRGPVSQAFLVGRRLGLPLHEEQEVNRLTLLRLGVPAEAILLGRTPATNTADEARQAREVVESRGLRSVVVVTSPFHVRRARMVFSRILPQGVSVHAAASPLSENRPERWWMNHRDRRDVFLEVQKIVLGSLPAGGGR